MVWEFGHRPRWCSGRTGGSDGQRRRPAARAVPDASRHQELALDDGDILFLYTDGVAQARGPDNTYFQDRLADELAALAGGRPRKWWR